MRSGSQWKLFWKSRSLVKRLKTTWCRLLAFMRSDFFPFFCSIYLSHHYFNSNHSCGQIPELGLGWRLRFLSQQHLVRVWQRDAAEWRIGRWDQSFHYVRKRAGSFFLPLASAAGIMLPPWGEEGPEGNTETQLCCGQKMEEKQNTKRRRRRKSNRSHF